MDNTTLAVGCQPCNAHNAAMTEALAILEALKYAASMGWENILLQSDAQPIINYIHGSQQVPWQLQAIISDVKLLLSQLTFFSAGFIPRSLNCKAHQLASIGRTNRNKVCECPNAARAVALFTGEEKVN
ncbi:unnamed protein product [Musa acuminata subsp. malaccensis]|uniref:(wild Malaysian banana) hypothetical protein n=1 Tax=Musa acuminata subsp. malaccensis TaxID=214687 RepID=A0A804IWD7_MUSAM|nr:unnamed protein product [Musa acuminata subsp. malaccensis]